jgi:hypothetical protein
MLRTLRVEVRPAVDAGTLLQVNNPPCATCGSGSTQPIGMAAPTAAERPHAGRVEVYNCTVCGQVREWHPSV